LVSEVERTRDDEIRLLGLDVGDRRIGVAVSDPTGLLASPVEIYQRREPRSDVQHVVSLMEEYEATGVVVGLPLNMNGSEGEQALKTREFATMLADRGLTVSLWDERLSSVEVERQLAEYRPKRRPGRQWIDDRAAAVILQTYLDHLRVRASR
jgi:putative holliday junction resolvase